jgi:hypothetical protein
MLCIKDVPGRNPDEESHVVSEIVDPFQCRASALRRRPGCGEWATRSELGRSSFVLSRVPRPGPPAHPEPSRRHRYQRCASENQHAPWFRHRYGLLTVWCTAVGVACWHERDLRVAPEARPASVPGNVIGNQPVTFSAVSGPNIAANGAPGTHNSDVRQMARAVL